MIHGRQIRHFAHCVGGDAGSDHTLHHFLQVAVQESGPRRFLYHIADQRRHIIGHLQIQRFLLCPDFLRQQYLVGRSADLDLIDTLGHMETVSLIVPVREIPLIQRESHGLRLPGCQQDLLKSPQFLYRPRHLALLYRHIELHHVLPGPISGIGHIHRDGQQLSRDHLLPIQLQIAAGEGSVGKAMAEGEQHIHFLALIVAVTHKHTFPVLHFISASAVEQVRGIVLQPLRKSLRQTSRGIGIPVEKIHGSLSHSLAGQIHLQNSLHAVRPGHLHRASVVEHHHRVGLYLRHRCDQRVVALWHAHMLAVNPLRLHIGGKSGKNDCHIRLLRRRFRLRDQLLVGIDAVVTRRVGNMFHSLCQIHHRCHGLCVDTGAAASLVAGRHGKFSDKGRAFVPLQRQHAVLVFQKHRRLLRRAPAEIVIFLIVKLPAPLCGQTSLGHVQHIDAGLIYQNFLQLAALHGFDNLRIRLFGAGHGQIATCLHGLYPIVGRAPVTHDTAVKAPLIAENIGQIFSILRGISPVDPVVGSHNRPGLRLLYGPFKGGQVNLPQRPLIHLGGDGGTPGLLAVGQIMLHAGAHTLALNALHIGGSHLSRQQRILGKILEIPAAERTSLDIYPWSQQYLNASGLALFSQSLSDLPQQFPVKAGCGETFRRKADCLHIVVVRNLLRIRLRHPQSVTLHASIPSRSIATVFQSSAPEQSAAFSSGSISATRSLISSLLFISIFSYLPSTVRKILSQRPRTE